MADKKESKAKTGKKEKVEAKKKEPEVEMVTVMRFNKIFNKREKMTVPKSEMLTGYYGDVLVEQMPALDYKLSAGFETSNQVCEWDSSEEDCTCAHRVLIDYQ